MKFTDATEVREVIETMRDSEKQSGRSDNRALINGLFNGDPPLTDAEATELRANSNVSFLEGTNIVHKARSTWNNALLKPGNFFKVTLDCGPVHKRAAWSSTITSKISKAMKRSARYIEGIRATGAQVILHGVGPRWWPSPKAWCPEEIGLEDMLVPTSTRVNLSNLTHFALYQQFTPGELYRLTAGRKDQGKKVDPGWNMAAVNEVLQAAEDERTGQQSRYGVDYRNPEKIAEYFKANGGVMDSDAVATVDCWTFFHQDDDGKWYKKIIADKTVTEGTDKGEKFLYDPGKRAYAGDLSEILHVQFGDGANVAPFRWHSVRALGFLMYPLFHLQNRLRNRFMDAIFEATLQYFRSVGADDRAKLEKVELQNHGIMPEGLSMVPAAERWQVNEALVVAGLSQNRQLMSENASSFIQDIDNGTAREMTAYEAMARLNAANALVSSLLSMAYIYEEFCHREIARRFTLKDSEDCDVRCFRRECLVAGIPEKYLCIDYWNIETERTMGGGNKTLEITQAKALMDVKTQFDPPAQREVLRNYVLAVSDDPDLALRLVPDDTKTVPPAAHDAELAVGTLLSMGVVSIREGIDHISYVEAFLGSLIQIFTALSKLQDGAGELPSGQQLLGLQGCLQHVQAHIQIIAQDDNEKQRVRQYMDLVGRMGNELKAFGQRVEQQREAQAKAAQDAQSQVDQAKAQATMLQAQTQAQIATGKAAQQNRHAELKFRNEEQRKNAKTVGEVQRDTVKTAADIQALDAKTAAHVRATKTKADAAAAAQASGSESE